MGPHTNVGVGCDSIASKPFHPPQTDPVFQNQENVTPCFSKPQLAICPSSGNVRLCRSMSHTLNLIFTTSPKQPMSSQQNQQLAICPSSGTAYQCHNPSPVNFEKPSHLVLTDVLCPNAISPWECFSSGAFPRKHYVSHPEPEQNFSQNGWENPANVRGPQM